MAFARYVALGDSTSEGLDDPDGQGGYRGWANRLAERLASAQGSVLYANLAIRGRVTRAIREEQLAPALAMRPELATVVAGTNDLLRPRFDLAAYARDLGAMFEALRGAGATVLTFTMPDLSAVNPIARLVRGRLWAMNDVVRTEAQRTGARLFDLARAKVAEDPRLWSHDRLHANALGHARVAEGLAATLGLPHDLRWSDALPAAAPRTVGTIARAELAWTRTHFAPWLWRHLRGRSSGDARAPKLPALTRIVAERA